MLNNVSSSNTINYKISSGSYVFLIMFFLIFMNKESLSQDVPNSNYNLEEKYLLEEELNNLLNFKKEMEGYFEEANKIKNLFDKAIEYRRNAIDVNDKLGIKCGEINLNFLSSPKYMQSMQSKVLFKCNLSVAEFQHIEKKLINEIIELMPHIDAVDNLLEDMDTMREANEKKINDHILEIRKLGN